MLNHQIRSIYHECCLIFRDLIFVTSTAPDGVVLLLITFVVPGIKSISPSKYIVPVPSWTRTFYAAGTSILHTMTKYVDAERIFIKGPTTEKLDGIVGLKILRWMLVYATPVNIHFSTFCLDTQARNI